MESRHNELQDGHWAPLWRTVLDRAGGSPPGASSPLRLHSLGGTTFRKASRAQFTLWM